MPELLAIYVNWLERLVPARPRQVHRSKALSENPLAVHPVNRPGFDQLIEKIKNGANILPHLSRGILHGFKGPDSTKPKALSKRRDLDLLLNDWGVHHLHIGTKLGPDGFVERKRSKPPKPILFAVFRPNDAYLIDLMQHGNWAHEHLVEVMVREWPDANLALDAKMILPPRPGEGFSREHRGDLRNAGIVTFVYMDGRAFCGRGSMSTAGVAAQTWWQVNRIALAIRGFLMRVAENQDYVANIIQQRGDSVPAELDLHFEFFETGGFGITDARAGRVVTLG